MSARMRMVLGAMVSLLVFVTAVLAEETPAAARPRQMNKPAELINRLKGDDNYLLIADTDLAAEFIVKNAGADTDWKNSAVVFWTKIVPKTDNDRGEYIMMQRKIYCGDRTHSVEHADIYANNGDHLSAYGRQKQVKQIVPESGLAYAYGMFCENAEPARGAVVVTGAPAAGTPASVAARTGSGPQELPPNGDRHCGVVQSSMTVGQWTYLEVAEDGRTLWVALPKVDLQPGTTIEFYTGPPMINFILKETGTRFETLYFIARLTILM